VREAPIQFTSERVADQQCQSDQQHQRAMFRLRSRGTWPATTGVHAREVQLLALENVEIEYGSAALADGTEATAVVQAKRQVARKWTFPRPVTPPLVVVVCVRSQTASPPAPLFRINTWMEVEP
jgi:hypothetical protein